MNGYCDATVVRSQIGIVTTPAAWGRMPDVQSHAAVQCDGAQLRMTAAQLRERSVDLAAAGYSHVTLLAVLPTGARSAFDLPASWALAWCRSVSLGASAGALSRKKLP